MSKSWLSELPCSANVKHAADGCDSFLAPCVCLAVPSLYMRLTTMSESQLSGLPCSANIKHAADDCDSFLTPWGYLCQLCA